MAEKKIIAVVGATGAQGGGLARAILDDPSGGFALRAITRDPASEKAQALARAGADVVGASIDDEAALARAFEGAHGAFLVTFYWDHFSPDREKAQARTMAHAARAAGIRHAIWSTLEDTRRWIPLDDPRMPTLMERYKVPHLDAKGESDAVFTEAGVPTTFLLTSFYWDNLITLGMGPKRAPDGGLVFTLPMGERPLPGIAAEDIGRSAYGIFKGGLSYAGQHVGIAGEHLTGQQMADDLAAALGEPVRYHAISPADYRSLGFPGADDLGNMFQFKHDFSDDFRRPRDVARTRELNPKLQTFVQWLEHNVGRMPID